MTDPTAALASLLAALDHPEGGGAVWDLHAPDARLPMGGGSVRLGDLPRDAYEAAFMADGAAYAGARPGRPRGPALAAWRLVGSAGGVSWFALSETRSGEALHLGLGLTPEGIRWATLAWQPQPWDLATGEAQTLADYAYGAGLFPRSWLDCAWQRLRPFARPPVLTLPEAAFACAGSTDCCRIDWAIEVDAGFQPVLDALDFGPARPHLQGLQLPVTEAGRLALKDDGAACRYLDPDGRCAVHRVVGRQIFPPCAVFPLAFAQTPDGLAFSTSGRCGAARAGLGPTLAEAPERLYDALAIAANPPLRTPVYRLSASEPASWPRFREAEAELLAALADETLPLRQRLWVAGRVLAPPGPLPATPPAPLPEQRAAMRQFLAPWLERLGIPPEVDPLGDDELPEAPALARFLRNMLWSKVLSFHFNLATAHAVNVATWLLVRHVRAHHGQVPAAAWDALAVTFMHGAGMRPYLGDDDEARARRAMLGDPAFALWLTGY